MSGNFDFPPASSSSSSSPNPSNDPAAFPDRLQHTRSARPREWDRASADSQTFPNGRLGTLSRTPVALPPRRRRLSRRELDYNARRSSTNPTMPPQPPTRPTATPGSRYQNMRRRQQQLFRDNDDLIANLDEASEHIRRASAQMSDLTDNLQHPYHGTWPTLPDVENSQRRPKRRKLDHSTDEPYFRGFQYGHHGQVVPGRLKMNVHNCNGGEKYGDSEASTTAHPLYSVYNVLRNDKSVYCSRHDMCDLVLKHQPESVFHLQRLVIKAPERGFTSPVQEGMIFVSMSADDLVKSTSHFRINYAAPENEDRSSRDSQSAERLSLFESLNDPEVQAYADTRRTPNYSQTTRRLEEMNLAEAADRAADWRPTQDIQRSTAHWPARVNSHKQDPPLDSFDVTFEIDGKDEEQEDASASAVLADRLRRDARWRIDSDDEYTRRAPTSYAQLRSERRSAPCQVETSESRYGDEDAPRLEPHAQFFMPEKSSKMTVVFDPPIAGKFILLKMWAPIRTGNIDVQSVTAYGFAGPRFFPACELR